jgi:hypothetical protein
LEVQSLQLVAGYRIVFDGDVQLGLERAPSLMMTTHAARPICDLSRS